MAKRKDKPPPEATQLQYDRGVQQLGRQMHLPADDDWSGREFGLPRPVEFTQPPGPRRPGRP